jgi:hypothetical protein
MALERKKLSRTPNLTHNTYKLDTVSIYNLHSTVASTTNARPIRAIVKLQSGLIVVYGRSTAHMYIKISSTIQAFSTQMAGTYYCPEPPNDDRGAIWNHRHQRAAKI